MGFPGVRLGPGASLVGMNPDTLRDFLAMAAEWNRKTRGVITVNSAFRSMSQQAALHAADPARASAPGRSMHNYGYALDLNSADAEALDRAGYLKRYGFRRPLLTAKYPEPWHVERAGIVYEQVRAAAAGLALIVAVGVVVWLVTRTA